MKWWNNLPGWVKYWVLPAAGIAAACAVYVIVADIIDHRDRV